MYVNISLESPFKYLQNEVSNFIRNSRNVILSKKTKKVFNCKLFHKLFLIKFGTDSLQNIFEVFFWIFLKQIVNRIKGNLRMIKLKRKLAGRSEFESFEHYIDFLLERITFQGNPFQHRMHPS